MGIWDNGEWRSWVIWLRPALYTLGIVTAVELICGLPGGLSLLMIPLSLLGYAVAAITFLVLATRSFLKKQPRKATSYLIAIALPVLLWRPINWATDCIHIGLTVWLGVGELAEYKAKDGQFAAYDWSVGLVTNPSTFLIYDKTDELPLPMSQHKHLKSSESDFVGECAGSAQHLIGHYYGCSF